MRTLKDSFMVHAAEVRVSTTAGDAIHFLPGKETFVPAYSVSECQRHGARLVKVVRGSDKPRLGAKEGAGVTSLASYPSIQEVEVEEVDFEPDTSPAATPVENRNTAAYTPQENKLRKALQQVLTNADPDDFTDDYVPKLAAVRRYATDIRVAASGRDRVWKKMVENREITQGDLDAIFEDADDGSDADDAA